MEGEVVAVGKLDAELLRLFEVWNVSEKDDPLTDEPRGVQRDPDGVAEPIKRFLLYRKRISIDR